MIIVFTEKYSDLNHEIQLLKQKFKLILREQY